MMETEYSRYIAVDEDDKIVQERVFRTWDTITIQQWIDAISLQSKSIFCQDTDSEL